MSSISFARWSERESFSPRQIVHTGLIVYRMALLGTIRNLEKGVKMRGKSSPQNPRNCSKG